MSLATRLTYVREGIGYFVTALGMGGAAYSWSEGNVNGTYLSLAIAAVGVGAAVISRKDRALYRDIARQTQEIALLGERAVQQTQELSDLIQERLSRNV